MHVGNIRVFNGGKHVEFEFLRGAARETMIMCAELLRVYSWSASSSRTIGGKRRLLYGKESVRIVRVRTVGHYALQLSFSDGYQHGIYTYERLHTMCIYRTAFVRNYLRTLQANGVTRRGRA